MTSTKLSKYNSLIIDLLLLLFITIVLVNYDYQVNLTPEMFLMAMQLGLLWVFCRIIYFLFPPLPTYIVFAILLVGFVQAVWGLGQLMGYFPSRHALFPITGSFFNPGPFGGFIALMFPLVLHLFLRYRLKNKLIAYSVFAVGIVCLFVFPATWSRTAWVAAIVGCGLVLILDTKMVEKLKNVYHRHRKTTVLCALIFCLLCAGAAYSVFHLKTDSANGRLFMWKITVLAIKDAPITGVGLGGFPAAFADAQMTYFKSGRATETEKWVAGSPSFAFNEYLRMFLEQGILGGILFLLLTFGIIKKGIKNRQTGAVGSFLALSVFAFASYPYYLWEFTVVWVLLGTMCMMKTDKVLSNRRKAYLWTAPILIALLIASFFVAKHQLPYLRATREWRTVQPLFSGGMFHHVVDKYKRLYPMLRHKERFLFEYATALNRIEEFEISNRVSQRGLQISSDPVFRNIKGCNYHEMGKFIEAGKQFRSAITLLPNRIYPYFRLTLLYADSNNFQPEKMKKYARIVLEKEPKVYSVMISEMRDIVGEILERKGKK